MTKPRGPACYCFLVKPRMQLATPVGDWLIIDSVIDNVVGVEAVGGDSHAVELGRHIREVGWAQTRQHARKAEGWGGWPPIDDHLEIVLEPSAWNFIADQLRRWAAAGEQVAEDPRWDEDERKARRASDESARQIAEWITRSLAETAE